MKPKYLLEIMDNEPLLQTNAQCKDLVSKSLLDQLKHQYGISLVQLQPRLRPLQLLVSGGFPRNVSRSVEMYDFQGECWRALAVMDEARCDHGVAVIEDKVYNIGGRDPFCRSHYLPLATCSVYNLLTDSWSALPNMETMRGGHGVAFVNNSIYAIGGTGYALDSLNTC